MTQSVSQSKNQHVLAVRNSGYLASHFRNVRYPFCISEAWSRMMAVSYSRNVYPFRLYIVLRTKRVPHCYQFYSFLYLTSSKNHCNKDLWNSLLSTEWSKDKSHNPTSEAIPARIALDGNEYLQKSPHSI